MGCARTFFDPETREPTGIMCGSGIIPCSTCGCIADHLCDYPMGKGKTCSAPLCDAHAIKVDRVNAQMQLFDDGEVDEPEWIEFCPAHYAMLKVGAEAGGRP